MRSDIPALAWFVPTRELSIAILVALLAAAALSDRSHIVQTLHAQSPCGPTVNPIVCENLQPGDPSSIWDVSGAGDPTIQGFATNISVTPGETASFKINTPAAAYNINIYRMGYYGGSGARKVATISPSASLPQSQPGCLSDANTGLIDCGNWAVSASWPVPATAVSGIYFAHLTRTDTGGESHIFFVVRENDAASHHSDLVFQTSDTTWQAYNEYGGNSLYTGAPAGRAYKVSYNRPFTTRGTAPQDWVFNAEYPMVRFLEANGYDVSYITGVDSDRFGATILSPSTHKMFVSIGHDEYWSGAQRANIEAARAAGLHLAFFSGNEVFWKTRWEPSIDGSSTPYRTLVSYKETHANAVIDPMDPPIWTGTWRDPRFSPPADGGRPENALTGQLFMVNAGNDSAIEVPAEHGKMRFWRDTDVATLAPGTLATMPPFTLGYEWDADVDNGFRPNGFIELSSTTRIVSGKLLDHGSTYGGGTVTHKLSLYRHPSGAIVFGAGTVQWSWGLDANHDRGSNPPDIRMQQATVNLFADMGAQPGSLQPGLVPAIASTDVTAPTSVITSPLAGAYVVSGTNVTIRGTASEAGGGQLAGVEVSVDGGATWLKATGTTSWTRSWTATGSGSVTIKSRGFDDSGNMEVPSGGVTIDVGTFYPCPCSIWSDATTPPAPLDDNDPAAVELGAKFRTQAAGYVTAVRFYKSSANVGTHTGNLWTNAGALLATVTFTGETASGWQQADLSPAVAVAANTTYVVSYHAPAGHYTGTDPFFTTAVNNPPLRALANGDDGPNGVYAYSATSVFPTNTWNSENYWVDVSFSETLDTTAPTVIGTTPATNATGVPRTGATITATFSEQVRPASVTTATIDLRDPSGQIVPATVGYTSATRTATLVPSAPLGPGATYTLRVVGGASGVKDLGGNPIAADLTTPFTTAGAPVVGVTAMGHYDDSSSNTATTPAVSTRTATNIVVYVAGEGGSAYPDVTDSYNNTWTQVGVQQTSSWPGFLWVFTSFNAQGGSGHTFTATKADGFPTILSVEVVGTNVALADAAIGIDDVSPFETSGIASADDALLLGAFAPGWPGDLISITPGNGFGTVVEERRGYGAWVASVASRTVPAGTHNASWTMVGGANDFHFGVSLLAITGTPIADAIWPTVAQLTPAAGSVASIHAPVVATFSEPLDPVTVSSSSIELRDALDVVVPATVTYDPTTRSARLTPLAPLPADATYLARVRSGAAGVKDLAGNPLAADTTAAFTAADAPMVGASAKGRYSDESSDVAATVAVETHGTTNFVVLVHGEGGAGFPTITDTYNNTWTPRGVQQSSDWPGYLWVFTSLNAHGGPLHRFIASKAQGFETILAVEILGDQVELMGSAFGTDNVSPFATPVISSPVSGLLLGAFAPGFPEAQVAITATDGFTTIVEETAGDGAWVASVGGRTVQPGSYNAGWLMSGGVDDFDFANSLLLFTWAPDTPVVGVSANGRYSEEAPDTAQTSPVTTQTSTNLVVYVHGEGGNGNFPTLTDTYNNTWTPQGVQQTSDWPGFLWVFTSLNAQGGTNHQFTASKANGYQTILAVEVVGTNVVLADSASGIDNVSPFVTPTLTSSSPALLLGAFAPGFPEALVTITPAAGFTTIVEESHGSGAWVASVAGRIVFPGAYEAGWLMTGGVNDFDFGVGLLVFRNGS